MGKFASSMVCISIYAMSLRLCNPLNIGIYSDIQNFTEGISEYIRTEEMPYIPIPIILVSKSVKIGQNWSTWESWFDIDQTWLNNCKNVR